MDAVSTLTPEDLRNLSDRGITEHEARRQLALLTRPRVWTRLSRPCRVDDGIAAVAEADVSALVELHAEAAAAGRFTKFVPASGAASRMFKGLRGQAPELERFMDGLERFAFIRDLRQELDRRGAGTDAEAVITALFAEDGLGYGEIPKGLVKFHADGRSGRTAFEEHLAEAADYVRDGEGVCRVHFTVSPEHRARFDETLRRVRGRWESELGVRYEVDWSEQHRSTDTLAIRADGQPARDANGHLVLRPGGHGALIENLEGVGDLVFVKNIDNVQPEARREATSLWKRILAGYLIRVETRVVELIGRLESPDASTQSVEDALTFCREVLGDARVESDSPEAVARHLTRPLRVCGVVRNTGEPGGGPFWVREPDGRESRQIVEISQVDPDDAGQQRILRGSTHFNPVDLVCSLADRHSRPFSLGGYVDPDTSIVTTKTSGTEELRVLERPGLWNGAMARWHTLFVEVPLETFSPVKTVLDLLRPEHGPTRD